MSRHANNPYCSVTVVELAGYNGDDHFLLLILKGASGQADPLPYHFLRGKDRYHTSLFGQSVLPMLGNSSPALLWGCITITICDVDAIVSGLDVNEPTYTPPPLLPLYATEGQGRSLVLPDLKIILVGQFNRNVIRTATVACCPERPYFLTCLSLTLDTTHYQYDVQVGIQDIYLTLLVLTGTGTHLPMNTQLHMAQ